MNKWQAWKRLLWRETVEGRLVVLVAVAAPAVFFRIAAGFEEGSWQRSMFIVPAAAGVHLAIAVWAAGRGNTRRSGKEFSWTHLPVSSLMDLTASLFAPLMVTAILGLWFGWMAGLTYQGPHVEWYPLAGALDLATTYAVCYFMSILISNWAAVLFGVFRIIGGTVISLWDLSPILEGDVLGFACRIVVGSMIGTLVFAVLSRKKSLAYRQAVSLVLMVAIVVLPAVKGIKGLDYVASWLGWETRNQAPISTDRIQGGYLVALDGALRASIDYPWPGRTYSRLDDRLANGTYIRLDDQRKGHPITQKITPPVRLLHLTDDDKIYFARPGRNDASIVIWLSEPFKQRFTRLATIPVPVKLMAMALNQDRVVSDVSPDGRHLLIALASMVGSGTDLWLVDLRADRASVVAPGHGYSYSAAQVAWQNDHAIVWDPDSALAVNLKTLAVSELEMPNKGARL